ncbi:fungal-specific transcription factor domain-containing protein [Xylariales sp. PMI_506]|nr:fungal-specific transcription factor domain-containing protein [Xylariales sp. PMI_506]
MTDHRRGGTILAPLGCWTCKDRKVRCDRTLPGCLNCTRVRRNCQGYGTRLFWPKADDAKRAIFVNLPAMEQKGRRITRLHMINASFQDLAMHNYLLDLTSGKIPRTARALPERFHESAATLWRVPTLGGEDAELIHYFVSTAFSSLVIFNQDAAGFRDLLLQLALSNASLPSRAVLYALLAVSSQYRYGLHSRAMEFKMSAISALAQSAKSGALDTVEAAQHVAAGMLLCSFEIHAPSETAGQWLWYVRGAKDVIKTNHLDSKIDQKFVSELLDWVDYHDVISQFSILHWRHGPVETVFAQQLGINGWDSVSSAKITQIANRKRPSHRILQFLSEIFSVLLQTSDQVTRTETFVENLNLLEGRSSVIAEICDTYGESSAKIDKNATYLMNLFRLAAMIYLARASESISGELRNVQPLIDEGFLLMSKMRSCDLQFPLAILGAEARTDEQRMLMLDLVRRTELNTWGRTIHCLREGLRSLWVQDDLATEQELVPNYMDKLSVMVSRAPFIPSLV